MQAAVAVPVALCVNLVSATHFSDPGPHNGSSRAERVLKINMKRLLLCNVAGVPLRVELPVASVIHDTVNTMSRDLQGQLRRQSYDFEQADKVLVNLGVRISRKNQPKKRKPTSKAPQGAKQSAEQTTVPEEDLQANKRAHIDPQVSEARAPQTTAGAAAPEAADRVRDAQAESILHVPTTPAIPLGSVDTPSQPGNQSSAESASQSLPPPPLSGPKADPPASQTSLAAAAAAAMGGPSVSNTEPLAASATDATSASQPASNGAPAAAQSTPEPSTLQSGASEAPQTARATAQQQHEPRGNFSSNRGVSSQTGNAGKSSLQQNGESVKLYDVNRR